MQSKQTDTIVLAGRHAFGVSEELVQTRDWRFGHRMWLHRCAKNDKSQLSKSPWAHAEALRTRLWYYPNQSVKTPGFLFPYARSPRR